MPQPTDPAGIVDLLAFDRIVEEQITNVRELAPREARFGKPTQPISPSVSERLHQLGIHELFSHQAKAYDLVSDGHDVTIVTGTNSGKSLCYVLPTLQMCATEPAARALFLFPTKALAQDQQQKLEATLPFGVRAATYDGDTPQRERSAIRKLSQIALTNPDMLHVGINPYHELWTRFLKSLRIIVLDEMHVYRGVFGSHVGGVLRRLLRLCEWHGAKPQVIACSATIGNPLDLFSQLTGRVGTLVAEDGSPSGKRTFVFWSPPAIDEDRRLSTNVVSSELLVGMAENGLRVMAFARARVSAEIMLRICRDRARKGGEINPESIDSYRAGYTPEDRRKIERALFDGTLKGLTTTNAMELGVDVGALDAVIMNGYPGSIASFWQQAGRAGRGTRDGLAVLVAQDDPLEHYLIRRPELLLDGDNEQVSANPSNPQILGQQLRCAAHERPLTPIELADFAPNALEVAEELDRAGELRFQSGRFYYPSHEPPAPNVSIRGTGGPQVRLTVEGETLGGMERWRAMQQAHTGAVYLHRGATYIVEHLDLDGQEAFLHERDVDHFTQAIIQSVVEPMVVLSERAAGTGKSALVAVRVTDAVVGFRRKSLDGGTILSLEPLELPPSTYETLAVRFDIPLSTDTADWIGGIHGTEHALLALAPLLCGADRRDLGSSWYTMFPDSLQPAIFVFDRTPGGVGLCDRLHDSLEPWLEGACHMVSSCDCSDGCPACLYSSHCEVSNETLDKRATIEILTHLGGRN